MDLPRIQEEAGIIDATMEKILASHLISADLSARMTFGVSLKPAKHELLDAVEIVDWQKIIPENEENAPDLPNMQVRSSPAL